MSDDLRILLVDDSDVDRLLVRDALNQAGVKKQLIEASSGPAAMKVLRESPAGPPFVVLLDVHMPGQGGFEFLAELRQDAELADTVVYMLTTSGSQHDVQQAHDQRVAGYLVKPRAGLALDDVIRMFDPLNQLGSVDTSANC